MGTSVTRLFDAERFRALMPMSEEEEQHLLALFLDNQRRLVDAVSAAIDTKDVDFEGARRAGHRLKSSARSVGADALVEVCQHMEYACAAEAADATREQAAAAIAGARQLEEEIRCHLEGVGA